MVYSMYSFTGDRPSGSSAFTVRQALHRQAPSQRGRPFTGTPLFPLRTSSSMSLLVAELTMSDTPGGRLPSALLSMRFSVSAESVMFESW